MLAKAYATHAGCLDRIVFAGGFLQENELARREIAQSMSLVGGRALFCRHSEFLGAIGSLGACIHHHREQQQTPSGEPGSPRKRVLRAELEPGRDVSPMLLPTPAMALKEQGKHPK